ncbi:MAG: hypothetical protein RL328_1785, partial [Acidobacteriota bacterium]
MRSLLLVLCSVAISLPGQTATATKPAFTVETMLKLARISEPVISPDGLQVAFTVQSVDVTANTKPTQIYVVPVAGGTPRQLTREGSLNGRPRWSADSKRLYFISNRSGSSQVWSMNPDGSQARQITKLSTEAGGVSVAANGERLVFVSNVYPDCGADDACNAREIANEEKSKVKARLYTSLLFRHWNEWKGQRRQHLLSAKIDGSDVKDLTPGSLD